MPIDEPDRRDPEAILAMVRREEATARRGRFRIYFGASAGVGKTYAMLAAAQKLAADGADVIVGIVETHGRAETIQLLAGLEQLPLKSIEYRGSELREFDLDAALSRRPALLLVDELAHSNVPGSRHPKRWQDIQELLSVGIDVFSTLNVQHLESLNDVVGGITNVRVWETVPDKVFDEADEVVMVDIPAEELLARLKAGKVYLPQQAERAAANFFRKGNLMALREIALRRTADRVEDDVQTYRVDNAISAVWKTEASLLACIGPDPSDAAVVRSAARLAGQLTVAWHAVYVETPALERLPRATRERVLATLKKAEALGASTAVLPAADVAHAIVGYSRSHNVSKVIVGRSRRRWHWLTGSSTRAGIGRMATDIDLIEVPTEEVDVASTPRGSERPTYATRSLTPYAWAVLACLAMTVVAEPFSYHFDKTNVAMLYLLTVVLVAVRWGRRAAVTAAFLSVAAFDFFFVPPRFTFSVSDIEYMVTFSVMLAVALITGQLTANLRFQARVANSREQRARALYELARELSGLLLLEQVLAVSTRFIRDALGTDPVILIPDERDRLQAPDPATAVVAVDLGVAQWAFDKASPAGIGTDTLAGAEAFYLPLKAPMRTRGVLVLKLSADQVAMLPEQRQQLDTFAALIAIALERVHYVDVAQRVVVQIESERLRNSLLAALSHDLRTPLAALYGLADLLANGEPPLAASQRETAEAIVDSAQSMSALVNNMLDMARIQSGQIRLNLQWQPIEEVVGSTLRGCRRTLSQHQVEVNLPPDLPLVRFDATLIERVLVNLLVNAANYTPPGSRIWLSAAVLDEGPDGMLQVKVEDNGPGLSPGKEEQMFEQFVRGDKESAKPGVGLGLGICRAIVRAHGGEIRASQRVGGGASFTFTLPLGSPPPVDPMLEANDATVATP